MADESPTKRHCVPCEKGGKPLSAEVVADRLENLPGWILIEHGKKIMKNFQFMDFKDAMGFLNEVADIAEFEGHHPDVLIHDYSKADVALWTYSCKGLTENDFIMAALIDRAIADRNS